MGLLEAMDLNLQQALQQATGLRRQGRLAEAEGLVREILAVEKSARALGLLGVIQAQQARFAEAEQSLAAALQIDPRDPVLLINHGNVLGELGQFDLALASHDVALSIDPSNMGALGNRANILQKLGRFGEAVAAYDAVLAIDPHNAVVLNNRGIGLREMGRLTEALESCTAALARQPDYVEAMNIRATILNALGRPGQALSSLDRALAIAPRHVDALMNRASALTMLKRFGEALAAYGLVLAASPDHVEALNGRGVALHGLGRPDEAIAGYDQALQLRPAYGEAWRNRGIALIHAGRFDDALGSFGAAIATDAGFAEAYWSKATLLLLMGRFDHGLPLFEWRKKLSHSFKPPAYPSPVWTGAEDPEGKTLFIYAAEQGLGDTIQFLRYALMARGKGAHVVLSVQDELIRLLQDADTGIDIIGMRAVPAEMDYHIALMSLPLVFRTNRDSIPAGVPYLRAQDERVRAWARRIGKDGLKVGISWQGRKDAPVDAGRSFPVAVFEQIAKLPGVRLISLQKNAGAEQLSALPPGMKVESLDQFDSGPDAFLDTAAIMENLDLVITSDTAIAHLAGALGRPVWVAVSKLPDWRWFLDRADSPWYPTMRLFRQRAEGDWSGVFEDMRLQLAGMSR